MDRAARWDGLLPYWNDVNNPADPRVWAKSGATWWMEGAWDLERTDEGQAELQRRIQSGPPR